MQRVDARDIAEIAVKSMTESEHDGKTYNIVGPKVETGESCAKVWSDALQKEVNYIGNDLNEFQRRHSFMDANLLYCYSEFYGFYQENGLIGTEEDLELTTKLLGRVPNSLENYASEVAPHWQS